MPDLRKDPIVGRWVIIAESRANRPQQATDDESNAPSTAACPFCAGNESATPHEISAWSDPGNGSDWRVRVVPNKFPALEIEGDLHWHEQGLYDRMRGVGAHEVIIESPRHITSTTDLDEPQLAEVLAMYRLRLLDLQQDKRLVSGMIFKNVGAAAGASLDHTHSQLIATPIVPISLLEELDASRAYHARHGQCVFCDLIARELDYGERLVAAFDGFVAFCPFAPRFPFETWILPTEHSSHFESQQPGDDARLARILKTVIGKIEGALGRPAYNYIIHSAPFDTQRLDHYHWHIEIIPRVVKTAGFEWGSGFYINAVPPERAAATMRDLADTSQGGQ